MEWLTVAVNVSQVSIYPRTLLAETMALARGSTR